MTYRLLLFIVFYCSYSLVGFGQQQAQFTQYYINPYIVNQAAGGTSANMEASIGFRKQWVGFKDAPITTYASGFIPYNIKPQNVIAHTKSAHNHWNTIGGYVYHDKTGPTSRKGGYLSFAHNMPLTRKLRLSVAIAAGAQEFSYNTSYLELADKDDLKLATDDAQFVPDMNINFWLYHDKYYLGASVHQILENEFDFKGVENTAYQSKLIKHYFFQGAYKIPLAYKVDIITTSLVKVVPNTPSAVEIGAIGKFDNTYWVGTNYRWMDALSLIAGMNFNHHIDLSYSYEMSLSSILGHNYGSHELTLIYRHKHGNKLMCAKEFW